MQICLPNIILDVKCVNLNTVGKTGVILENRMAHKSFHEIFYQESLRILSISATFHVLYVQINLTPNNLCMICIAYRSEIYLLKIYQNQDCVLIRSLRKITTTPEVSLTHDLNKRLNTKVYTLCYKTLTI